MDNYDMAILEALAEQSEETDEEQASERLFGEVSDLTQMLARTPDSNEDPAYLEFPATTNNAPPLENQSELIREPEQQAEELNPLAEKKAEAVLKDLYKAAENGKVDGELVRVLQDYYGKRTDVLEKINSHLERAGSSFRVVHDPEQDEYSMTRVKRSVDEQPSDTKQRK